MLTLAAWIGAVETPVAGLEIIAAVVLIRWALKRRRVARAAGVAAAKMRHGAGRARITDPVNAAPVDDVRARWAEADMQEPSDDGELADAFDDWLSVVNIDAAMLSANWAVWERSMYTHQGIIARHGARRWYWRLAYMVRRVANRVRGRWSR